MENPALVLESAISDVGYWSWWQQAEGMLMLEFGGVQLLNPPLTQGGPPSSQLGIRFGGIKAAAFLDAADQPEDLPQDWPERLRSDELQPFSVNSGQFTLSDRSVYSDVLTAAANRRPLMGAAQSLESIGDTDSFLAFWAGPVGFAVVAQDMAVGTRAGSLSPEDVLRKHAEWWEYWKQYWRLRNTAEAMPEDYACEVTIPVEEFSKMDLSTIFEEQAPEQ